MTDDHLKDDPVPTGVELTPLDEAFQVDPHPVLARLRAREPVHYDQVINRWVLTRSDDVESVLRDRSMSVDPRKANEGTFMRIFERFGEFSMLFQDPPEHTRLRALVSKAFTPRAVERLRPRIHEIIGDLLGAVASRARFDVIEAFAGPLPVIVIAEMLGVDPADRQDFKRWSDSEAMSLNPLLTEDEQAAADKAGDELREYLQRALDERRAHPRDDLISGMIAVEEGGDELTDGEIVSMCELLLAAGNVTTTDLIGNGLWVLLRHPDQLQKLRDDLALIANAVEEILRFESPVMQSGRIPMSDLEIGGCPIRRGESVMVSLAAANRDPGRYRSPTASTSRAKTCATSRLEAVRTSASALRSRGSRRSSPLPRSSSGFRAFASPTSRSNGARSPRSGACRSSGCWSTSPAPAISSHSSAPLRDPATPAARRGALLVACASLCWSSGGLIVRLVGTGPWTTAFWRSLCASVCLGLVLWVARRRSIILQWRDGGRPVLTVAMCLALASTCFILSLAHTSVADTLLPDQPGSLRGRIAGMDAPRRTRPAPHMAQHGGGPRRRRRHGVRL